MKVLFLECGMGAAGDMLTAALSELLSDRKGFEEEFAAVGIPDVTLTLEKNEKCGICGTHSSVRINGEEEHHHHHHHHHRSMAQIEELVDNLNISEKIKNDVISVYKLIADAESKAHGRSVSEIHFHEVGTLDAIADVTAVCMLMDRLSPVRVIASPVCTGTGFVNCAHGTLPVPAPATAHILRGAPIYSGDIESELCTPTGAALLMHFADEFGEMPRMCVNKIGYGMGTRDFKKANCLRAMYGETEDNTGEISELRCNIDDMSGEMIAFAAEELIKNGALDVYTMPITMKKNRPAVLLTVMCRECDREKMLSLIFKHTTTLGIREYTPKRYTLEREEITLKTQYGDIKGKKSSGFGTENIKPEYEELARLARENGIGIKDIKFCRQD